MQKFWIIFFVLSFNTLNIYAWNSVGHKLVAQIAFANMSLKSKKIISEYNNFLNSRGHKYNLIDSAVWMDKLYAPKYDDLRRLHYIDTPYITDNVYPKPLSKYNAIFAIKNSLSIINDLKKNKLDKAIAFRILWHVVADLHQPMHAVSRYSKKYPEGDKGGNLEILPSNKIAKNLHAYWDRGAGVLYQQKPFTKPQLQKLIKLIRQEVPCDKQQMNLNPEIWAAESYAIATKFAYNLPVNYSYEREAQKICIKRIALAGCRLAALLDTIKKD